ncbi:TetR family transcriptional regulator [Streptomyces zingiberis]|uniref:TetR family transcriptional regulator n=1 Tax=Streptomyces zingiberis TaxID=2053010 RepID=UPI002892C4F1|nr:TetR family transcriptional regulator [Streptomyces zingiberis]
MTTRRPVSGPCGLRERKKQRTRAALIRAALGLFTTRGYERTTVDEIAEAVQVSQRTFFRYFSGKEDVAFAVQERVEEEILEAFAARPPDEPPLAALRGALSAGWDRIAESVTDTVEPELHLRMFQVIECTPALLAVMLRRCAAWEDRLAREIARRTGTDPGTDPRPRVLAATFIGVTRAAGQVWGAGPDNSAEALRAITERHLDQLVPALAEDWHRPAAAPSETASARR